MVTAKYCYPDNGYYPIDELDVGSEYNVNNIVMGQSHTYIYLENFERPFNSVNFEFFEDGHPIDIFKDERFNLYIDLDHDTDRPQEDTTVNVTKHATKRIRQRLGINKKSADKNAEKALKYGITHSEAKGKLCKYMDGIFLLNCRPNNMRVYNHSVYLFRGNTLITVIALPHSLWAIADKQQSQKENNDTED